MSNIDLLYTRTRSTSLTRTELEQMAYRLGMGTYHDDSVFNTKIFTCQISGELFRDIGTIYYSPDYMKKRGGVWRIRMRKDASATDLCVMLETLIPIMKEGPSFSETWDKGTFTNEPGWFRYHGVCRPLSDYDGDELFTMVSLPADVEAGMILEQSSGLSSTEVITSTFETRNEATR